jgi:hypothetical protein
MNTSNLGIVASLQELGLDTIYHIFPLLGDTAVTIIFSIAATVFIRTSVAINADPCSIELVLRIHVGDPNDPIYRAYLCEWHSAA